MNLLAVNFSPPFSVLLFGNTFSTSRPTIWLLSLMELHCPIRYRMTIEHQSFALPFSDTQKRTEPNPVDNVGWE
ncbi:hypothetical protein PILCRDRAFT_632605 [Piloderma croceum F 1598]|uniref:Uncharacterized protein n=1 Tax=Piloderma croceum (strain F 1598) TaxID=765440 RepID=A0A0C3FAC1_PILCF|nr:hypothetical protein PILCRDRAFT_632605 [Piloderma croceum F 1598]